MRGLAPYLMLAGAALAVDRRFVEAGGRLGIGGDSARLRDSVRGKVGWH